ncbi:hypothetical protein BKA67DRAFT_688244 [Truncatella angustata]|uniref:Uncharacterized protein n=1 Tax=Truncatella angustata TaxID=152316 RepID=A0A9P8UR71_9PEZI|nr:uncharacterized protein BKA67DRAFT_688244 [Truncatella angustata]KAH6656863.1 hypothetical protein BKA67DRAFT_688244 [Truncatella angustata]
MSQCVELDDFELSARSSGLHLVVSSHLFVSGKDASRLDCHQLYDSIQAEKLWLLPPNIFYLQLSLRFDGHTTNAIPPESNFLEHLAITIALSTLWDMLGVSIKCTEVTYDPESQGDPDLLFEVEHPDKASALLSPPGIPTSTANGLVCSLEYHSRSTPDDDCLLSHDAEHEPGFREEHPSFEGQEEELAPLEQPVEYSPAIYGLDGHVLLHNGTANSDALQLRRSTGDLALATLYKIFGLKRTFRGIRVGPPISPTLLELAPTVFNAHYMQTTATYARTFSAISDTIINASNWRLSIHRKVEGFTGRGDDESIENSHRPHDKARTPIQQQLWTMLRASLDIAVGTQPALRKVDQHSRRMELEDWESHLCADATEDRNMMHGSPMHYDDSRPNSQDYDLEDRLEESEINTDDIGASVSEWNANMEARCLKAAYGDKREIECGFWNDPDSHVWEANQDEQTTQLTRFSEAGIDRLPLSHRQEYLTQKTRGSSELQEDLYVEDDETIDQFHNIY